MSTVSLHHPDGRDFDRFLYAAVGEDRNGDLVTVLSTFARLGLDPWQEASELATLSRDAARVRLDELLSAFKDVPALGLEHGAVAAELASFLPERLSSRLSELAGPKLAKAPSISMGWIFGAMLIIYILVQLYFLAEAL